MVLPWFTRDAEPAVDPAAQLPAINTPLRLARRTGDDGGADTGAGARPAEVLTRLEDIRVQVARRRAERAELVVAQPIFRGNLETPPTGTGFVVRWLTDRGLHEVPVSFVLRERIGIAVMGWRLAVSGPVTRTNRRAHVRVDITCPVELAWLPEPADGDQPGVTAVRGRTVNVSEGGLLALVDGPRPPVGTTAVARLRLDGELFVLPGTVLRHQDLARPGVDVHDARAIAMRFDRPAEHGDSIRRHLFRHQRTILARGLR